MNNKKTAEHLRKWVAVGGHGCFAWPTDGCGYDQSVRFAKYRNNHWPASTLSFDEFILEYAAKIEIEPD